MSSLKSPSIRVGILVLETYISILGSMVISACSGTLGDLYITNICIQLALDILNVVHATSMPLDVK